jgi:ribosomal protein S18 acetylase RimI-like enzyme
MERFKPTCSELNDWLMLASEVEAFFGPMVDDPGFLEGLKQAFANQTALSVKTSKEESPLAGGVVVDPLKNEIAWLVVARAFRRKGVGDMLLKGALNLLDPDRLVKVVTFAPGSPQAEAALSLYKKHGFIFSAHSGLNPAGLAVDTLVRPV